MQKFVLTCFLSATALAAVAQTQETTEMVLDVYEDTTHVVTIADIIDMQQRVTTQHSTVSHYRKVWDYKSFFNLSYETNNTLKPKESYTLGYPSINQNKIPDFKADYGLAVQLGHCYNLLKKPLANIVNFNIDFTYIDLGFAHYQQEAGKYVYDSEEQNKVVDPKTGKTTYYQYMPWGLGKYDLTYGMNIGPSITVAPFVPLNIDQLDFLKLNIYYHIGYEFGILWMSNNPDADKSYEPTNKNYTDPMKINWQHGLTQSFGFNLSWKFIGLGYETRWDNRSYKSFDTETYNDQNYKFAGTSSRIYLRINY